MMFGHSGKASSIPVGIVWGGILSIGVTLVMTMIYAWLIVSGKIEHSRIGYVVMIILIVASYAGAKIAHHKTKRQKLIVCMLAGITYFLELTAVTALFFGGQYSAVGESALLILCGSMLCVMTEFKDKKSGKRVKLKY